MSSIRYLADASLHHGIVSGCLRREPSMDFLSANAARLEGVEDPEVLRIAAESNRILVTHDLRTMPVHFAGFLAGGGRSPGVLLVKQGKALGATINALALIWAVTSAAEWENRIVEISKVS